MYYGIIIGMIIIIMNMHKEYVFYEYLCLSFCLYTAHPHFLYIPRMAFETR